MAADKHGSTEWRVAVGVVALGISLGYLLVLAAVAVGTLFVLVRLFGDAPSEGTSTRVETVEDWRGGAGDPWWKCSCAPPAEPASADKDAA